MCTILVRIMRYFFLTILCLLIVSCDGGLAPPQPIELGFNGTVYFTPGSWPPVDSLISLKIFASQVYPLDSAKVYSGLFGSPTTIFLYPGLSGSLPFFIDSLPYSFPLRSGLYKYVGVIQQNSFDLAGKGIRVFRVVGFYKDSIILSQPAQCLSMTLPRWEESTSMSIFEIRRRSHFEKTLFFILLFSSSFRFHILSRMQVPLQAPSLIQRLKSRLRESILFCGYCPRHNIGYVRKIYCEEYSGRDIRHSFSLVGYTTLIIPHNANSTRSIASTWCSTPPGACASRSSCSNSQPARTEPEDVPVSVSTVTSKMIADRLSVTLDDALRYVPGVNMMSDQVNIRGSTGYSRGVGSRVLILIDVFHSLQEIPVK